MINMSWLALWYWSWSYFASLVDMTGPAVDSVYSVLINPYFLWIILVLVAITLIPSTDN